MLPVVQNISNKGDELKFTLSNVNVSYANGLRRIILSEIPTLVIESYPYEKNNPRIPTEEELLEKKLDEP